MRQEYIRKHRVAVQANNLSGAHENKTGRFWSTETAEDFRTSKAWRKCRPQPMCLAKSLYAAFFCAF